MIRMATVLIAATLAMSGVARAEPTARIIAEHESQPGESKEAFLQRYAVFLDGWTGQNGVEACGVIAEKDGAYSVITQTVDSQVECSSNAIYSGWASTGETIHSHPPADPDGWLRLNAKTIEVSGDLLGGRTQVAVLPKTFSPGDIAAGPGYLVCSGELLYQSGDGTAKAVASIR